MDIRVGDTLVMKKPHPCGARQFIVRRVGADFKLECTGCSSVLLISRAKAEKNIRQVTHNDR